MAKQKKGDLRFQVIVKAGSHPALHAILDEAGPYKMSKRMLALAAAGLMLERSGASITQTAQASSSESAATSSSAADGSRKRERKSTKGADAAGTSGAQPAAGVARYVIPDEADDLLGDLFDSLGMTAGTIPLAPGAAGTNQG